jgi:hypothetical protein
MFAKQGLSFLNSKYLIRPSLVPLHYSKNSSRASRVSAAAAAAVFLLLSIELESLILLSKTLPYPSTTPSYQLRIGFETGPSYL